MLLVENLQTAMMSKGKRLTSTTKKTETKAEVEALLTHQDKLERGPVMIVKTMRTM